MHQINKAFKGRVIGGIFSNRESAGKAIEDFQDLDISRHNIQMVQLEDKPSRDVYASFLVGRGFSHSQALYYDKAVRVGKILVAVYEVNDHALILNIFDKYKAEYQTKRRRNYRLLQQE